MNLVLGTSVRYALPKRASNSFCFSSNSRINSCRSSLGCSFKNWSIRLRLLIGVNLVIVVSGWASGSVVSVDMGSNTSDDRLRKYCLNLFSQFLCNSSKLGKTALSLSWGASSKKLSIFFTSWGGVAN